MTIEQAIKKLESCSIVPFMEDDCEAAALAIIVLKEQQERDEGCGVCSPTRKAPSLNCTCEERLRKALGFHFCHECGRKLGENNA